MCSKLVSNALRSTERTSANLLICLSVACNTANMFVYGKDIRTLSKRVLYSSTVYTQTRRQCCTSVSVQNFHITRHQGTNTLFYKRFTRSHTRTHAHKHINHAVCASERTRECNTSAYTLSTYFLYH